MTRNLSQEMERKKMWLWIANILCHWLDKEDNEKRRVKDAPKFDLEGSKNDFAPFIRCHKRRTILNILTQKEYYMITH